MLGVKSSVFGMGVEAHVVFAGFSRMDCKRCMSNSFPGVAVFWVVVSLYLGEAIATSLEGDLEDGSRTVIIQTEVVGSFRRQGMSTRSQLELSLKLYCWCVLGVERRDNSLDPDGEEIRSPW